MNINFRSVAESFVVACFDFVACCAFGFVTFVSAAAAAAVPGDVLVFAAAVGVVPLAGVEAFTEVFGSDFVGVTESCFCCCFFSSFCCGTDLFSISIGLICSSINFGFGFSAGIFRSWYVLIGSFSSRFSTNIGLAFNVGP